MAPMTAAGSAASGLGTGAARWAVLWVWVTGLLQSVLYDSASIHKGGFVAAGAALAAAILVTRRGDTALGRGEAAVTAALIVLAEVVGAAADDYNGQAWVINFPIFMAALLIARGSVTAGLVATGVSAAFIAGLGALRAAPLEATVGVLSIPFVAVVLAVLWRMALIRMVRNERAHRSAESRAALEAESSRVAAARTGERMREVRAIAAPLLRRIADGDALTPADLVELRVVEGGIRDSVRSPAAHDDALAGAIARARRRGVKVLLLWDGLAGTALDDGLRSALVGAVDAAADGSVVIRAVDAVDGEVSVVVNGGTRPDRRLVLDRAGVPVARG